nr:MAG TPA: hypothetical protein [Caudoviricetes sp.]
MLLFLCYSFSLLTHLYICQHYHQQSYLQQPMRRLSKAD